MFASNIPLLMKEKKMTARKIISITGLSSTTITKARSNSGISECRLSTLGRIATALEVGTKELYEEADGEHHNDK